MAAGERTTGMSVLEAAAQNYMADVSFSSSARVPRESTPHIVPDEGSVLEAADLISRPRRRMLFLLLCLSLCGVMQLYFSFSIPYFTIGLLGLMVLCGSIALAREVYMRRTKYLLWVGFFQAIPMIVLVYVDYVNLAEALDKDDSHAATEDDLEHTIRKNVSDRAAAYVGIALDCVVVILCVNVAEASLALHRAFHGLTPDEQPWLVHLVQALQGVTRAPPLQWAPRQVNRQNTNNMYVGHEESFFDRMTMAWRRGDGTAHARAPAPAVSNGRAPGSRNGVAGESNRTRDRRRSDGLLNLSGNPMAMI